MRFDESPVGLWPELLVGAWHGIVGRDPHWLYFDSKLTNYAELSRLNERGIWFVVAGFVCA